MESGSCYLFRLALSSQSSCLRLLGAIGFQETQITTLSCLAQKHLFISGCMDLALRSSGHLLSFIKLRGSPAWVWLQCSVVVPRANASHPQRVAGGTGAGQCWSPSLPAAELCLDKSVWDEQANLNPNP